MYCDLVPDGFYWEYVRAVSDYAQSPEQAKALMDLSNSILGAVLPDSLAKRVAKYFKKLDVKVEETPVTDSGMRKINPKREGTLEETTSQLPVTK